MGPLKLYELSKIAFKGIYTPKELREWLGVFITRGFQNQHKRQTNPAGLMIGLSLSQRSAFRVPSEADWHGFMAELDEM
jgi:NAD+ synthase (glutamine-hydrolysing)